MLWMCQILNVSRSGYYAWRDRPASDRTHKRQEILQRIRHAHIDSHRIYGSPRVHAELVDQGMAVCVNTVARYMRQERISSKIKRRFRVQTTDSGHDCPVAPNLLERKFEASRPNEKWCSDITYVPTQEGFLYVAAVVDLWSRKIVGWAMADHLRGELCVEALKMAIERRRPEEGLLHHSDRGVQYACMEYRELLESHGMIASMSRTGNCYDNAMMERVWGSLKSELTHHEEYQTREEAKGSVFEYMEVFYNRRRRHSAIGYMSPEQFEASLN
jgi:putative transposase